MEQKPPESSLEPNEAIQHKVFFICCNSHDKDWAELIAFALEEAGF